MNFGRCEMRSVGVGVIAMALCGLAAADAAIAADAGRLLSAPVRTSDGLVSGVPGKAKGVAVFKGIPFGAPPIGDLRWKPAQPVTPWDGIRAADKFGPACM